MSALGRFLPRSTHTLCPKILPALRLTDAFHPPRLNTFESTLAIDEFLSAHVNWTITVPEDDASPSADKYDAYEKEQEHEQESREDDQER